ncbi:MAG: Rrf2 family transcriptional regulator [Lachnospiraceae bacterium]|mgnify:FL=1|jgi:Rrf2 family protein|nr:Rrf2 family transcriptional regulator [Lachnospiraceae bacterium]
MQISSRFTIAIHIFACIDYFGEDYKLTSDFLAGSVNVNPVVIRRLLQQLKAAGLINVARGSGGTTLAKPLKDISLLDVYQAVECVENGELFHFHDNPNPACPVGRNIHHALDDKLDRIQKAMEDEMRRITLAEVVKDTRKSIVGEHRE